MSAAGRFQAWLRRVGILPRSHRAMPLAHARLVVVDVETTGLQVRLDPLLSIAAVVIEQRRLDLAQQFEGTLRADTARALDNILIHGFTPSEIVRGGHPERTLRQFLAFIGDSPLLAFHAAFDQRVLRRACRRSLGVPLRNPFIDVAELAPALLPERQPRQNTLDAWLEVFGLTIANRHNAAADAMATGELALILLHAARHQGIHDLDGLRRKIALSRRHRLARDNGV